MTDVPPGAITVDAPVTAQEKPSTCGPACLAALSRAWSHPFAESDWERVTRCTSEGGAAPQDVARALEGQGFAAVLRENATWRGFLLAHLLRGTPVLCAVQAHGGGHWVLCVGCDPEGERVYVQDPLAEGVLCHRDKGEWLENWHDRDRHGRTWKRLAIAVGRPPASSKPLPAAESSGLDVVDSWLAGPSKE